MKACCEKANFIDTNRWFHDRQPDIILVWQLSKQNSLGLPVAKTG
jgi:hypothetical protein